MSADLALVFYSDSETARHDNLTNDKRETLFYVGSMFSEYKETSDGLYQRAFWGWCREHLSHEIFTEEKYEAMCRALETCFYNDVYKDIDPDVLKENLKPLIGLYVVAQAH